MAACSEGVAGSPRMQLPEDGPSDGASPDPSSTKTPTVDIPPRPRELPLDGLDPCTLLTDAQIAQLKVTKVRPGEADEGHYKGTKDCLLNVDVVQPYYGYGLSAVTFEGIEVWLAPGRNIDPAKLISTGGYPAAEFHLQGADDECNVAVGVAEGQLLLVTVRPLGDGFTLDQLCQMTEQAAEMAISTLQTLK